MFTPAFSQMTPVSKDSYEISFHSDPEVVLNQKYMPIVSSTIISVEKFSTSTYHISTDSLIQRNFVVQTPFLSL